MDGGSDCLHGADSPFIYAHAVIMALCALVAIPAAVLLLHLRGSLKLLQVRRLHETIQLVCALSLVVGLAFAIKFTADSNSGHFASTHGRLSLSVLIIIAVQIAVALTQRVLRTRLVIKLGRRVDSESAKPGPESTNNGDHSVMDMSASLLDNRPADEPEGGRAKIKQRLFVLDAVHRALGYILLVMLFASAITGLISYSSHCGMVMDSGSSNSTASASSSGSGARDDMMMAGYLQFAYQGTAMMLNGWILNYSSVYIGTLIVALYIAFVFEALKIAPMHIERRITAAFKQRLAAPEAACHEEPLPWAVTVVARGVATLSVGLRVFLGFLLMYLLMAYNIGIILAMVIGACLGFVVLPQSSAGGDECM